MKLTNVQRRVIQEHYAKNLEDIRAIFKHNPNVHMVRLYPFGFVPRAYRYKKIAPRIDFTRDSSVLGVRFVISRYDQKRLGGVGPYRVIFSRKMGRLNPQNLKGVNDDKA